MKKKLLITFIIVINIISFSCVTILNFHKHSLILYAVYTIIVIITLILSSIFIKKFQNIEAVLKRCPGALYILDANNIEKVEFISNSVMELSGHDSTFFHKKNSNFTNLFSQPERDDIDRKILSSIANHDEFFCISAQGLKKDGSTFALENVGHIVKLKNGKTKIIGILEDASEKINYTEEIERQIKEKDILLKEIHHRVKNNLAMISSLINLQIETVKTKSAKEALDTFRSRVTSILLVHQKLYKERGATAVNTEEYFTDLADNLIYSLSPDRKIKFFSEIEKKIKLDIDRAIPLGMIASEILTNSLKHAFDEDKKGIIKLNFCKSSENFTLKISDNGKGFPEDLHTSKNDSLGLQLIEILSNQLNGSVSFSHSDGWNLVELCFPVFVEDANFHLEESQPSPYGQHV
ncbi:MAG: sensor histidine kinase [Spirochaetales bacterium]|nr:sensor histidine kinase [Spirochaetales bacterium]